MTPLLMSDKVTNRQDRTPNRGHILIVDDDGFFTKVLGIILTGENYRVTIAGGLPQARALLAKAVFDVIISDLRMPDGDDGLAFLEELRSQGNRIPFIMLTGYGEVDNYMVAMNAGATEYLNKPVRSEELLAVIQNCLRPGDAST
jgi:DNA-binding NtrC family response regulator